MSDWPINMLDAVVIVIIVLSAIVSVVRGFVREVLAIASWVGAALVTLYGLPYARPYLREVVDQPLIADAITGVVLFVVALMVFSLIS
ncbi:MAG: CvpA family protein, partial [Rhodospirillaceae bacterium]|nr:CvpA family protein [Rhodospirillaceae bacterium]